VVTPDTDAAWAAEQPRVARNEAERMIGSYAAYLMRAIDCLPPSERRAVANDIADLLISHFGRLQ
jgi:hypothetical protein